jgi:hypothetical protein
MFFEGVYGVLRAAGVKTAAFGHVWAGDFLVNMDDKD